MDLSSILKVVDHTLLSQTATWEDIKRTCDEGIRYGVASVCIPPYYVKEAKKYVNNKLPICTVIGFPNGYSTTESKMFECRDAISNGADELDMVVNIGLIKSKKFHEVENEINKIKNVCGKKVLKVIIETCLLTEEEKIMMCKVVTNSGADFIKTSTGFSKSGATVNDIELFSKYIGGHVKIKAAGGIKTLRDAEQFISLGADRLGTSRIINLVSINDSLK